MSGPGSVALVLHAHLPYVRHPEHARSIEERWLFEALWECYLPIVAILERLGREGARAPLSISVSPPLAAMLRDPLLTKRFDDHLARLERLAAREARRREGSEFGPAAAHHAERAREARRAWDAVSGDVLGALAALARKGQVELMTSAATHGYLPGVPPEGVRAQLRLGRRSFERLTGLSPVGLWLPECAFEPRLLPDLARSGFGFSVLDAHGLELARPRPDTWQARPVVAPGGFAFFGRDSVASREVWSREVGYPGHPAYRDFYRDVGFDLPEDELDGEVGPHGTRLATGLKYHRVTARGRGDKEPYVPREAEALAREHARDFVERRSRALARLASNDRSGGAMPISVAAYDAELFGHWWFEGPVFLEEVLRRLADSASRGGISATSLGGYLEAEPAHPLAEPSASTWGEGGYGEVWAGPEAASLWRHARRAVASVAEAARAAREAGGVRGLALDQAIREAMLLLASDWAFMIHRGDASAYASTRFVTHHGRALRLADLARASAEPTAEDAAWVRQVAEADRIFAELEGPELRDAFDPL